METKDDNDRRAHPRHPMLLQVEYPGRQGMHDFTENLSEAGLFIRTDLPLRVGERLPLVLSFSPLLPGITLEVEVVRVRPASPSEPAGVGARVPIELPEERRKLIQLASAFMDHPGRPIRVLLVEDNKLLAHIFSDTLQVSLKMSTVTVEFAQNGEEALARLQNPPLITLVVTDLMMPVVSGLQMIGKMHANPKLKRIPVVAVTSDYSAQTKDRAVAAGAALVLRKPVRAQDLVSTVQALVVLARLSE